MKNFIFVLMTVAYSMLSSFLFWLFFKWITPYVMNASWIMLLLYPFLALSFICMIVSSYGGILSFLNGFFMKDNMAAKVIYTIICLSWGYSSCALPFRLNMEFGVCQWILAIMLTCTALCTFAFFILVAYVKIGKTEIEKLH